MPKPENTRAENRADEVLGEYMLRVDRGEAVDREEFLRQHPDVADELRVYFADSEAVAQGLERAQARAEEVSAPVTHSMSEAPVETATNRAMPSPAILKSPPSPAGAIPLDQAVCDGFEGAWTSGQRPQIEDCLGELPEEQRGGLLRELVALEMELRQAAGEHPVEEEYLGRFPQFEHEIRAAFARTPSAAVAETLAKGEGRAASPSAALRIRCPHCHQPIEIVDDRPLAEITCTHCGSSFGLVGDEALAYRTEGGTIRRRQKFGQFELLEQLGSGAFGAVWKARDTQLDRVVALKIPRKGQLDAEETEKFVREARAAAQLRHPNVVTVHEVGMEGDTIYMVSDFVEGVTLADWLTGQKVTYREAAELCAKIAEALHHAHEQGVIHRDLKPSNIMLDRGGEPHIMDFGLAKREAGEITMTFEGQILGTPSYMSPEQAKGEGHAADRRTDVYSMGVILFELLTGEMPFRGNIRMLLKQIVDDPPPRLRKLDNRIPRDLETICLKCLEKHPSGRYGTAKDLWDELRRHLRGEAIKARPISSVARIFRWCKRNPVVAALIATAALLLVAVAIVGGVGYVQTSKALGFAETQRNRAEEALEKVLRGERAEADLYGFQIQQAQREYSAGNYARAAARLLECPMHLRRWEWHYLTHLCSLAPRTALKHEGAATSVAFSPDGRQIASGGADSLVKVWDAVRGEDLFVLKGHTGRVTALAFRGDGSQLASGDAEGKVKLWDAKTGRETLSLAAKGGQAVAHLVFSRDGSRLVGKFKALSLQFAVLDAPLKIVAEQRQEVLDKTIKAEQRQEVLEDKTIKFRGIGSETAESHIRVWRLADGRELFTRSLGGSLCRLAVDDDAEQIVIGSGDGKFQVWQVRTGQVLWETKPSNAEPAKKPAEIRVRRLTDRPFDDEPLALACSRDGKLIASEDPKGHLVVWDVAGRRPRFRHKPSPGISWLAFDPRGEEVAVQYFSGFLAIYDCETGKELRTVEIPGHRKDYLGFLYDGRWIASTSRSGEVRVVDALTGSEALAFSSDFSVFGPLFLSPHGVTFSDDVTRAASVHSDGSVKVRPIASERDRAGVLRHEGDVSGLAYRPDGRELATAGAGNAVRTWDLSRARQSAIMRGIDSGPASAIRAVAYSPDGRRMASAGTDVLVWGQPLGDEPRVLHCDAASVAFSPDGQRIVAGCLDGTVKVWNPGGNHPALGLQAHSGPVNAVAFTPDGLRIVSGSSDATARVWDSATGGEILCLRGHSGPVNAVTLNSNGDRIVSGSDDAIVKVWDAAEGRELLTLQGHTGPIQGVALSPDGKRIASASADKTVKIWDAATGRELLSLQGHNGAVSGVAFRPDGMELATADSDGIVNLWKCQATSAELAEFEALERSGVPSPRPAATRPDAKSPVAREAAEAAPHVRIMSPRAGATVRSKAKVNASIYAPAGAKSLRVKVYANGVDVTRDESAVGSLPPGGELAYETEVTITRDRKVLLQLAVYDTTGVATYSSVPVEQPEPEAPPRAPRLYVVALGIGKFRDPGIPTLISPVNDARAVARALTAGARSLYDVRQSVVLLDQDVTPKKLLEVLEDLKRRIGTTAIPEDLVVIYLSGHSVRDSRTGKFHYVGYDAKLADIKAQTFSECISWEDIQHLAGLRCRKLVVVDACHAGAIRPTVPRPPDDVVLTLAACKAGQMIVEFASARHGLFTQLFLAALKGRGGNEREQGHGDDVVRLDHVIRSVQGEMPQALQKLATQAVSSPPQPEAGPAELLPYLSIPLTRAKDTPDAGLASPTPVENLSMPEHAERLRKNLPAAPKASPAP